MPLRPESATMSEPEIPAPPPGSVLRACPNCAEPIRVEASVCRYCSRPIPQGLKILSHRDGNRGLGIGTDNLYVLWDLSTGQRLQVFAQTPEGWKQGWQAFTGRWPDGTPIKKQDDSNQVWAWLAIGFGIVGWLVLPIIFGPIAIVMGIVGVSQKQSLSWIGIGLGSLQLIYVVTALNDAFGNLG